VCTGEGDSLRDSRRWNRKKIETQRHKDTEIAQLDNSLSYKIIGTTIEVHRILAKPGLSKALFLYISIKELKQLHLKFFIHCTK
jgi:hypothetical protein